MLAQEGHLAMISKDFILDQGEDALKIYKFGKKAVEHKVTISITVVFSNSGLISAELVLLYMWFLRVRKETCSARGRTI